MTVNKNKIIAAAQKFQQKGQLDKAIKELQRLVDDDPKDVRTLLKIGDLYSKKGDRKDATSTYLRVAEFYSQQGFFLKAVAVYKQILRVDQGITEVNLKLAELYNQLGLISDAMTQFQQVVATYERQGQTHESLMVLRKMVELDPDNIASRIKLAELCSSQGLMADAVREFEAAAAYLKEQQRQDDWIKVAERLVFHDASRLDVLKELATLYLQRGDTKRALAKLQICFKTSSRDLETLGLLAGAFGALGQTVKSVSVYKEMAKIHEEEGQSADAAQVWDTIGQMAPDDVDYLARQGASSHPGFEPAAPLSFPSFPPTHAGETPGQPPSLVPVPLAPAQIAPAASGSPTGIAEQAAKLLSETDVYVKYGLKDRAVDHLRKIFELDPNFEPAYVKQKSIALAMGDRALAARAVENLVRIAMTRDDVDAAAGYVGELEGFLPGYAGLPALRGALRGGPLPSSAAGGGDDFDEVSVDITLGTEDEAQEVEAAAVEESEDAFQPVATGDILDLSAADALDDDASAALLAATVDADALYQMEELETAAAAYGDDDEPVFGRSTDDLLEQVAGMADEAVQSVVTEDLDELVGEEPALGIPVASLDVEQEVADDLILGAQDSDGSALLQEIEDDVEDFEEVLPTTMMSASEMAAMRATYGVPKSDSAPAAPAIPFVAAEPELLDDDIAGVTDDLVLGAEDEGAIVEDSEVELLDEAGGILDHRQDVLAASGLLGSHDLPTDDNLDTDDALLGGDGDILEADAALLDAGGGLDSFSDAGSLFAGEAGSLDADAGLLDADDAILGADDAILGAADAILGPDDEVYEDDLDRVPDDPAMSLSDDVVATAMVVNASDLYLADAAADREHAPHQEPEQSAFAEVWSTDPGPPQLPAPVFDEIEDTVPPVSSSGSDAWAAPDHVGAADALLADDELPAGARSVPSSGVEDEAFIPTTQFKAPTDQLAGLDLADDEQGAFGGDAPSPEVQLQQAIARASDPFQDSVEEEVGIGTATEIMGLSDTELEEIRAFATGAPQRLSTSLARKGLPAVATPVESVPDVPNVFDEAAVTDPGSSPVVPPDPDDESDPAQEFFADELGEADFFVRQGLLDEARDILHAILEDVPESRKARALLDRIGALESGDNGEASESAGEGAFDLASELLSELEDLGVPDAPSEDFQYSVEEVFSEFKRGVEKSVSSDDADTHYDLGIAYKEMGLVEDSIHEFEIATQGAGRKADALYMMGLCEVELGRHASAVKRFKDAMHVENINPGQKLAVMFELGVAHQSLGQSDEALHILEKVFKKNPKFKDVAERVQTLGGGDGGATSGTRASVKKGKNISYL
ncbi:MAG: tetratricopeptide repeat protein [Pseudomonadota bacterium]